MFSYVIFVFLCFLKRRESGYISKLKNSIAI